MPTHPPKKKIFVQVIERLENIVSASPSLRPAKPNLFVTSQTAAFQLTDFYE
jgi:hypothetical protein